MENWEINVRKLSNGRAKGKTFKIGDVVWINLDKLKEMYEIQENPFASMGFVIDNPKNKAGHISAMCTHCWTDLILNPKQRIARAEGHLIKLDKTRKIVSAYCPAHGGIVLFSEWLYKVFTDQEFRIKEI
jgi:hypothetical protein